MLFIKVAVVEVYAKHRALFLLDWTSYLDFFCECDILASPISNPQLQLQHDSIKCYTWKCLSLYREQKKICQSSQFYCCNLLINENEIKTWLLCSGNRSGFLNAEGMLGFSNIKLNKYLLKQKWYNN